MQKMNATITYHRPNSTQWYEAVQLSPSALLNLAKSPRIIKRTLLTLKRLSPDDYLNYIIGYYKAGLKKFKQTWEYSDILTHLQAASQLLKPIEYLEIGVRRGRSLAIVARENPYVNITGFDLWVPNYAGMENPGPDFVVRELKKIRHKGKLELISGDSKETIPAFFQANKETYFDLINVDGDHSEPGARIDLENVMPRLKIGGAIFLDDITHPQHRYLENVWDEVVASNPKFMSQKYTDLGYGVAFAIRRSF